MPDSFDSGKMKSSVDDDRLVIQRRTYRSGDFVHVVFSLFAAVFAILVLVIAISNGTLFDRFATPLVIFALVTYGYFGVTRIVNRRTVTVCHGRITAKDGPLPQFIRTIDTDLGDLERLSVESSNRWTFPPISTYRVYSVHALQGPNLFRRLPTEGEATYALAKINAFVGSGGGSDTTGSGGMSEPSSGDSIGPP